MAVAARLLGRAPRRRPLRVRRGRGRVRLRHHRRLHRRRAEHRRPLAGGRVRGRAGAGSCRRTSRTSWTTWTPTRGRRDRPRRRTGRRRSGRSSASPSTRGGSSPPRWPSTRKSPGAGRRRRSSSSATVVGRCWESIERARVARDLRESEERQRTARRQPAVRLHLPDRPRGRRLPPLHLRQRGRGGALRGDAGGGGRRPGEPLRPHRGGGPAPRAGRGGGRPPGPEAVRLPVPRARRATARSGGCTAARPRGTSPAAARCGTASRWTSPSGWRWRRRSARPTGRRTSSSPCSAHELRNPLAPLRNGLQVMRLAAGDANAVAQAARHDGPAARPHGAADRRPARRLPDQPQQDGAAPLAGCCSPTSSAAPSRRPARRSRRPGTS